MANVVQFDKTKILEKDRENLMKTRKVAMDHLEHGTPLVPKFEEKIRNFATRYNLTRGQVLASILSDPVAASAFAKTASRQRTAEKAQIEYLSEVRRVPVEALPSSGRKALRLVSGEIVQGAPRTINSTKTFDAVSKNGHTTDYIFAKFTQGFGGAQDNQAMDVINFLEAAREYTNTYNDSVRFVAIIDGDYYTRHWNVFTDFRTDRILVETSDTYKRRGRKTTTAYTSRRSGGKTMTA